MRKKIIAIMMSMSMIGALCACSNQTETKETVNKEAEEVHLNLPESWEFESFYPIITPENSSSGYGITYYLPNLYDTLVQTNESGEIEGMLAKDWVVSDDGKTYTFHLREDVKFADGSECTSEDVQKSLLATSVNLGQYNGSYGKLSTIIEEVTAVDNFTVELKLTQPYYSTLRDLCLFNPFSIVSSEQLNEDLTVKDSFVNASYGTGPYMYQGDGDGQTYEFVKNPYYWGEEPDVDSFSIKVIADNDAKLLALKNGELDFMSGISKISSESYEEIENTEGFGAKTDDNTIQTCYLGYNLSSEIFGDQTVRTAIASAIDKESVVENIFGGVFEKADTLFTKDLPYCDVDQTIYEFNVEQANQILDEAGYVDTDQDGIREKDGVKIEADLFYQTGSASDDNLAVYLCDQLSKIGISLTPKSLAMMDWYAAITGGEYGLTFFRTQGGYYDPANIISNMDPSNSMDPIILQVGSFLPTEDNIISEVNSSADETRIQEIYATILTTIADNALITPLYYTHQIALYNHTIADYDFPQDPNNTAIQNIKLK